VTKNLVRRGQIFQTTNPKPTVSTKTTSGVARDGASISLRQMGLISGIATSTTGLAIEMMATARQESYFTSCRLYTRRAEISSMEASLKSTSRNSFFDAMKIAS
jgi:hypothetical protein